MRFVAPDTNYILHFEPLGGTSAEDIGLEGSLTWLIVGQVMRELDIQKGTGPKPLRKVARRAVQQFEKTDSDANALSVGNCLEVFFRTREFEFDRNGLLQNEGDDKVLADLLDFKLSHPGDEVILLSDDSGARMKARKRGLTTIQAPENRRLRELEDERDTELRVLTEKYRTLAETQPALETSFGDGMNVVHATVASFNQEEFNDILSTAALPQPLEKAPSEEMSPLERAMLSSVAFTRPNPEYEKQLATYIEDFREYILTSWIRDHRTVKITPAIRSRNGVEAAGVNLRIKIKTNAEVLTSPPKTTAAPTKPKRRTDPMSVYGSRGFGPDWFPKMNVPEFNPLEPDVSNRDGVVLVKYDLMRLRQEDVTTLDPFYIVFDHDVVPTKAIELHAELRATNMNIVVREKLLVKVEITEREMPALYLYEAEK